MKIDDFIKTIDKSLYDKSGKVFYSGCETFEKRCDIYLLGLNPGGIPDKGGTIQGDIDCYLEKYKKGEPTSAYCDEWWNKKKPGQYKMQQRVRHLLNKLGFCARKVPASNLVFVRSQNWKSLAKKEKEDYIEMFWPFHEAVIKVVKPKVIVFMGQAEGWRVMKKLGGEFKQVDKFVEKNNRKWKSELFESKTASNLTGSKIKVAILTHPSWAKWDAPATDPSEMVKDALADSKKLNWQSDSNPKCPKYPSCPK